MSNKNDMSTINNNSSNSNVAGLNDVLMSNLLIESVLQTNQNEAMLALQKRELKTTREFFYLLFGCMACGVAYFLTKLYEIKTNYKFLIDFIDLQCKPDGFNAASGLSIACCLTWSWYNAVLRPSPYKYFASAILMCIANKTVNQAIMDTGHPGVFFTCLHNTSIMFSDDTDVMKVICTALRGVSSGAFDSSLCLQPCKFGPTSAPGAMSIVSSAFGGASSSAGLGMVFHSASSTLGAASGWLAGGTIVVGTALSVVSSIMDNNRKNADIMAQCNTAKAMETCLIPDNTC